LNLVLLLRILIENYNLLIKNDAKIHIFYATYLRSQQKSHFFHRFLSLFFYYAERLRSGLITLHSQFDSSDVF